MPSTTTVRKIREVTVDLANGEQTRLDDSDRVYDAAGRPLALGAIPDALAYPDGWIDYETAAQWRENEPREREPWESDEDEPWHIARSRIYARGVVHVMVVYDECA